MTTQDPNVEQKKSTPKRTSRIWGWVLLLPALICCVSELAIPTVKTVILSLQKTELFGNDASFIGLENYTRLFQHDIFLKALGFTLLLTLIRLLIVAVVPPLLALVVNQFGRPIRIPVRLLYTLPIVAFAPVMVAVTWFSLLNPEIGLLNQASPGPQQTKQMFLTVDALYTLGLAVGIGLVVYLIALRYPSQDQESPSRKQALIPLAVGWGIGLLATIALSLQSFSFSYVLTGGFPAQATTTLGLYQYTLAFQQFRFGVSAAVSTLTLIILTLLGIIATLVILWSGLKLKTISWNNSISLLSGMNKPLAIILLIAILLASISIGVLSLLPAFWNVLSSFNTGISLQQIRQSLPLARIFINSVAPIAVTLLFVQLPVAYLGALAIGAFRPLGRRSEWLLLLFAPWLFVGIMPLSISAFLGAHKMGTLNTFMGLMPPILISIPILFILTLFFKGHVAEWNAAQSKDESSVSTLFKQLILPSLPLTALLATVALFVGLQTLLWPLIVATKPTQMTLMTALLRLYFEFGPTIGGIIILFWLPVAVLFLIIFGIFQIFYMDRLSLFR